MGRIGRRHNGIGPVGCTMKVAITGASGFLGRAIVRHLMADGHECRGLIRPDSRHAAGKPAINWVTGGLGDVEAVAALVDGADALIHAAHDAPGGGFVDPDVDVADLVERNLVATIRLVEAARRAGVGRVVVITSGAVHDVILPDRPLDEAHPLWPLTHYGATKAAIEAFVSSYGRGAGLAIAAVRPTAIYGLADPVAASRWHDLVAAVARGEAVDCRRGGKQVHADDVARAVGLLLAAPGIHGEVYDCTDLFVAERDVAEIARAVAGIDGAIDGTAPINKNPIDCAKLRQLGMSFGGRPQLEATIAALVGAIRGGGR